MMKTLKRIYGYAMCLAIGLCLASCADENDWDVDSSHDRLFGVANDGLDVNEGDTWAEVVFEGFRGTEYYVIEVSRDSLTDETPMGGENSMVYGEDGSITTSPDTIRGLFGETKYFLRIKAMSSQTTESKWVYFDNGNGGTSFVTDAEQLFNDIQSTDRGDTWMRLTWVPGSTVTRLTVATTDGNVVQDIDLTQQGYADAVAAGELMIEGLTGSTTYVFTIYQDGNKRGELTVATMASPPAAGLMYTIPSTVTVFSQDLIDEIANEALAAGADPSNYSVTIGIPAGSVLDFHGTDADTGDPTNVNIPEGMSVTFFGLAGGDAPTLNMTKSVGISGSHSYIRFENVRLVDTGCQYFINQSDATTIGGDLSFTDCTMNDFERSLIRLQSGEAKSINEVNVINCVATNMSHGNGYSVFYWNNAAYTVGTVNITNSTFDTFARSFLEVTNSNTGTINISDCTFYSGPASGRYFIDANSCDNTNVNVTRCIFALSPDPENCRGIRCPNAPVITEVYFTSDFVLTSNKFDPTVQLSESAEDVFADPANHDFTIIVRNLIAGDPRWLQD